MDTTNTNPSEPAPEESLSDKKTKKGYLPPKLNVIFLKQKEKTDPLYSKTGSFPNNSSFTEEKNSSDTDEATCDM
ncbi:hypothetical protein ELOC111193_16390 [Elizabethkingia occulta]|uniref:Uncharacterized protein n=1 Tax=Elizabethkingia occulta TaxID=1867263 RepID=A0A1T3M9L0_9FLAO|nr:hypothetical protein [Elizabethkingia occulta]OPB86499.1 hypothetical protein BB020_06190 [Elizabethkingia occulta]OPC61149.1 hypothetical protein BAZ10_11840 [Elizabethkingia occulta]